MIGRFINADGYVSTGQGFLGLNMYAYCLNNPVNMSDSSGNEAGWSWHYYPDSAKSAYFGAKVIEKSVTAYNRAINYENEKKIKNEIKEEYTKEDAKIEIDTILSKYGSNCKIEFDTGNAFEITESYRVGSRYDRQKICMIVERTDDITTRGYANMASEWLLHNYLYYFGYGIESIRESAEHATM